MTLSEDLVEWALSVRLSDVPADVATRVRLHLLDGIGVALAAQCADAAPFVIDASAAFGSGEVPILGTFERRSAVGAAFGTGVLMHALDFDDTHTVGLVHSTVSVAPAALAAAIASGATGSEVLRALVIGHEVVARLASAAPHGFHARGFHATAVCGTYAAALVSGLVANATREQMVNALGIAGSQAAGSLEFLSTGASTKQIHPGWSAAAGMMATQLARAGATGPATTIEGSRGLYRLYTDADVELASVSRSLGASWSCEQVRVKPYPACHLIHRTLDAAAQVVDRVAAGRSIDRVRVEIPRDSVDIIAEPAVSKVEPRSPYEAKFSLQWSVAAMLTDGVVNMQTYEEDRLRRPDIVSLAARVDCEVVNTDLPAAEAPGRVAVRWTDGRETVAQSFPPSSDVPAVRQQVVGKLEANIGKCTRVDHLIQAVDRMEEEPTLAGLYDVARAVVDGHDRGAA